MMSMYAVEYSPEVDREDKVKIEKPIPIGSVKDVWDLGVDDPNPQFIPD